VLAVFKFEQYWTFIADTWLKVMRERRARTASWQDPLGDSIFGGRVGEYADVVVVDTVPQSELSVCSGYQGMQTADEISIKVSH
jgi:hypothetical protein